jgi:uncharacterized membrane protein YoaK (UPF0700 family)
MSRRVETGPPSSELFPGAGPASAVFLAGPQSRDVAERGIPVIEIAPRDGYIDRLLKYIPAEIIALYLGVTNAIPPPLKAHRTAVWIVTVISALCVPLYMYLSTRKPNQPALWSQIAISSVAFPLWVFAIGGPFALLPWYDNYRWVAAVTICFATFLFGLYVPAPAPLNSSAAHSS